MNSRIEFAILQYLSKMLQRDDRSMIRNIRPARKSIYSATTIIYLAASFCISSVDAYHAVGIDSNVYAAKSLDTSVSQSSQNGALRADGHDNNENIASIHNERYLACAYAIPLLLCLVGIFYEISTIFRESQNSPSNKSTRRAAIESILIVQPYCDTTVCPTAEPRNGGSYYGSISSTIDDSSCPICLEDYCGDQLVVSSNRCKHIFHKECVLEWLEKRETCPCCRILLVTQNEITKVVEEKKNTHSISSIIV